MFERVFERYTESARHAVYYAHVEATHRDERSITVRDLLLGLTYESDGRACKIASLKENAVELRALLSIPHLPSTPFPYKRKIRIPLDDDAKKALAYATEEADQEHQFWIDSDHLLRALLRFPNIAADALIRTKVQLENARSASIRERVQDPPAPIPKLLWLKVTAMKYWATELAMLVLLLIFIYLKSQG